MWPSGRVTARVTEVGFEVVFSDNGDGFGVWTFVDKRQGEALTSQVTRIGPWGSLPCF